MHHRIFKADHTYHLVNERDKRTIPMAWWNGPAIVAVCQLPFLAAALLLHKWGILCGAAVACTLYFTAYEYLHWCMHLPKKRHVERSGIFFRLNGHHLLHHRYMGKNFNVVLPLADLCLRHAAAAFENRFRAGAGLVRAQRAAEGRLQSSVGSGNCREWAGFVSRNKTTFRWFNQCGLI